MTSTHYNPVSPKSESEGMHSTVQWLIIIGVILCGVCCCASVVSAYWCACCTWSGWRDIERKKSIANMKKEDEPQPKSGKSPSISKMFSLRSMFQHSVREIKLDQIGHPSPSNLSPDLVDESEPESGDMSHETSILGNQKESRAMRDRISEDSVSQNIMNIPMPLTNKERDDLYRFPKSYGQVDERRVFADAHENDEFMIMERKRATMP